MKPVLTAATIICSLILLSASCKKDKPELEQLPPATQEGRRTFGCLVNGKAFTPKGSPFAGPILSSYYQLLNSSEANGYFFNVSAIREYDGGAESIAIGTKSLAIEEGKIYTLKDYVANKEAFASYATVVNGNVNEFTTTNKYSGELHVIRLDTIKQIVSGTFWFNAVNSKGEKVEVREGRFDMIYTQ